MMAEELNSSADSATLLQGHYYDGQSSRQIPGTVTVDADGKLSASHADIPAVEFGSIKVSSRVGNSARYLTFADGARFETLDNDALDQLCQRWHSSGHGLADRLERNMKLVVLAVVVVGLGSFAFLRYGIPALSGPIASLIPQTLDQHLGEQTQEVMDGRFFKPSELSEEKQAELQALFTTLLPEQPNSEFEYQLLFRRAGMPNAFALPNGTLVMTDTLVELADRNDMLAGILLHEIGHVEERHSIQMLVRQAGLAAVVALVTGDVDAAGVILLLPNVLAQAHYSQSLETDADTYALKAMRKKDIDTDSFADIMTKLSNYGVASAKEKGAGEEDGDKDGSSDADVFSRSDDNSNAAESLGEKIFDLVSSHPATEERIERFRQAKEQ